MQFSEDGRCNKQERFAKIDSAATDLSSQFKNWWPQGHYTFRFNADGEYFRILVSDDERPSPIELESRSKGLQWFFSFFLIFLAESQNKHRDCILLLDEPGLNLHPNAQTDLIRFFEQLSQNNQLIYTTHLPFLVNHNSLDRVKAVYTEKGLTKVSNDISKADKEKRAIQPVNAAIGITASQSLLVGCDIIIVEGVSDQFYLTMIKDYLISKNQFNPKKEIVFIPVGSTKAVKPVVSIIYGANSVLPISLLDSDKTGKEFQNNLKQNLYKKENHKVIETDTFTGKEGSEIEDLIPLDIIVYNFNRLFQAEDELDKKIIDINMPIMPQLENFTQDNQIILELGWKVKLGKKVKEKGLIDVSEELETTWKNLFETFQQEI
ncbi:MAG: ATP-dependent nuclease [Desulfovibrionaceae bacterium]